MDQKQNALRGYQTMKRQTASDQHIELQLFSSITARMRAESLKDSRFLSPDMADVLVENAKLWNILFCDLVNPENQLDVALRNSLIGLAEFTQSHTQNILRGAVSIDVLIDINTAIINGMKQSIANQNSPTLTNQKVA